MGRGRELGREAEVDEVEQWAMEEGRTRIRDEIRERDHGSAANPPFSPLQSLSEGSPLPERSSQSLF